MPPCGFAAGIAGALPQAGSGVPPVIRLNTTAMAPISATTRAKIPEKLNALSPSGAFLWRSRPLAVHAAQEPLLRIDLAQMNDIPPLSPIVWPVM